jgi:hypothetical protein
MGLNEGFHVMTLRTKVNVVQILMTWAARWFMDRSLYLWKKTLHLSSPAMHPCVSFLKGHILILMQIP